MKIEQIYWEAQFSYIWLFSKYFLRSQCLPHKLYTAHCVYILRHKNKTLAIQHYTYDINLYTLFTFFVQLIACLHKIHVRTSHGSEIIMSCHVQVFQMIAQGCTCTDMYEQIYVPFSTFPSPSFQCPYDNVMKHLHDIHSKFEANVKEKSSLIGTRCL